ncbi:MAG: sulfite exporter TauE/SafE family protein [Betaproteobacteria bacterium]
MSGWLQVLATSAFIAGLLGGVHCAAMCGGLVGAACGGRRERVLRYALGYNLGRLASYTAAGALAGALGQAGLWLRGGALAQQAMLALASMALIALGLYLAGVAPFMRAVESAGGALWRLLQPYSRWFLPVDSMPRALGLGALWGWLPCGMVYAVLLTALATGDAAHGALVMFAFGLGTLPNLLAIALLAQRLSACPRARPVRVFGGALIGVFGALGIAKAALPAAFAADGLLCHIVPGLAALTN